MRDAWIRTTKLGREIAQPATIVKHVGRGAAYVSLNSGWANWMRLVEDAWFAADDDRPASSYHDGRVLTVPECIEIMRSLELAQ